MSAEHLITEHLDLWTSAVTHNNGRGRGNNGEPELTGIDKLRELILELAVRGKLVPQDPEDEPASKLLERIEGEKVRLYKEGKIKKPKKLAEIRENEKPFSLPDGWVWERLPNVYYPLSTSGKSLKTSEIEEEGPYPVIDQGKAYVSGYTNDQEKLIDIPGPVVVFGDHTTARKYVDFDFVPGADGTKVLCPVGIFPKYFYIYLLSCHLENRGYARHFKVLNSHLISIPPPEQQYRIVEKVDELMALCDRLEQQTSDQLSAHETLVDTLLDTLTGSRDTDELAENWARLAAHFDTLFTTEHSIDRLEQTILQLAVMGRLVPQDPNDEPASKLLERIADEKRRRGIKQQRVERSGSIGGGAPLPGGWEEVPFGQVVINRDAERIPLSLEERKKRKGEHEYYGASGVIDKVDSYLFDEPLLLIGEDGANLINRATPIAFIAKGRYWVNNHAHVLEALDETLLRYLCIYINSISLYPYITGTAQPKMNQAKLNSIPVFIPPSKEQNRIVEKVDELMVICKHLKSHLNESGEFQLKLAESFVNQAVA